MWKWYNKINPFGLAGIKQEGRKYDPLTVLEFHGEWPPRSFYTDEEYEQLQKEGWECHEEANSEKD